MREGVSEGKGVGWEYSPVWKLFPNVPGQGFCPGNSKGSLKTLGTCRVGEPNSSLRASLSQERNRAGGAEVSLVLRGSLRPEKGSLSRI